LGKRRRKERLSSGTGVIKRGKWVGRQKTREGGDLSRSIRGAVKQRDRPVRKRERGENHSTSGKNLGRATKKRKCGKKKKTFS